MIEDAANRTTALMMLNKYGRSQHCGRARCGYTHCGLDDPRAGVYQYTVLHHKRILVRKDFYFPTNRRHENQQIWRGKFADCVALWQSLTSEQKAVYTERAISRRMSGLNLLLHERLGR